MEKTKPVRGIINIVETAVAHGFTEIFVPQENFQQASLVPHAKIIPIRNLQELYLYLHGIASSAQNDVKNTKTDTQNHPNTNFNHNIVTKNPTLDDIYGQDFAKRALSIAVAGHHNILFTGPPGSGKTLLARTALSLLPTPSPQEQIEITKIHALFDSSTPVMHQRPFRAPHHSARTASIIGGGKHTFPGEISLAHHGVLFLDEFPEFPRNVIEALRQPLENRHITINRVGQQLIYPANFMLIATMNPCPCGHLGDPNHACTCTAGQIINYKRRLSGPILDRIDLIIQVNPVKTQELLKNVVKNNAKDTERKNSTHLPNVVNNTKTSSKHQIVENTITDSYQRQFTRYSSSRFNSSLTSTEITQYVHLAPDATHLLQTAAERLHLSTRSYFKTIKVAQTIADFDGLTEVGIEQISEALNYRWRN